MIEDCTAEIYQLCKKAGYICERCPFEALEYDEAEWRWKNERENEGWEEKKA